MSKLHSIRAARADDADAIQRIAESAYALYIDRIGRRPAPMDADFAAHIARRETYTAEADGELTGYIILYPKGDHLFVENLAVDPAAQGKDIGGAMMAFAEEEAQRQNLKAIELYTNVKMTENLSLYPRLGYRETGRRTESGFDRVYFRKDLPTV